VPQVISDADETGAVTVSRREYVQDIFAPAVGVAFFNQTLPLNPGLEHTFPWLSQIAQNYEEYQFEQLIFHYRSTVTDIGNSTSGQCGTVIMATNYNAASPSFEDKSAMQAYDGAMSCKTTDSMTHGIECDTSKRAGPDSLYVRNAPAPPGQDIKSYDHGTFQFALANLPASYANQAVGELWVSYTVRLAKPKFAVARALNVGRDIFVSNATESGAFPLGTQASLLSGAQNSIGCSLTLTSNNIKVNFPSDYAGSLELILMVEGGWDTAGSAFGGPVLTGNVTEVADMYGAGGSSASVGDTPSATAWSRPIATSSASTNSAIMLVHIRVTPSTGGVLNSLTFPTSFTNVTGQASLDIHEYNAAFSTRALGIGPAGARSDAPILLNPQGGQVVPA